MLFRAVDEDAEVYINGVKVFDHTCSSTGLTPDQIWNALFVFDARPFLSVDGKNIVAVRVYNRAIMGGIYKPAYVQPDAERLRDAACATDTIR